MEYELVLLRVSCPVPTIPILNQRGPPYEPPQRLIYDLDSIICGMFGEVYLRHPKMQNLATLNQLGMRSFLPGHPDETRLFESKDFGAITRSTLTKSRIIGDLLLRLTRGHLQTQTSVGSVEFAQERLDAVAVILEIGQKFIYVKRSLAKRRNGRATIEINDEYDAQDLFRSLLCLFFEDVRPESWTPSYVGGSSRIDFLLPAYSLAIELKHSRKTMKVKNLGDELIVDRDRYKELHSISHLICLVFDYDGFLDGPRGLEGDLSTKSSTDGLAVTVKIYDR